MTVLWLDPLSILLLCVNLVELVQIYSVLMQWILYASRSRFYVLVLKLLSEQLYDIHMHHEVARDLWETLDRMYTESDVGREL